MRFAPIARALSGIALAALLLVMLAGGGSAQTVRPSVPGDLDLVKMVRMTMIAVHHANFTGNYTVLRDLGTPGFAKRNSAARLAEVFRNWRRPDRNLDAVLVLNPQWLAKPIVDGQGLLRLKGYFLTTPVRVRFDMIFRPVEGRWRLDGISLGTFLPPERGRARR